MLAHVQRLRPGQKQKQVGGKTRRDPKGRTMATCTSFAELSERNAKTVSKPAAPHQSPDGRFRVVLRTPCPARRHTVFGTCCVDRAQPFFFFFWATVSSIDCTSFNASLQYHGPQRKGKMEERERESKGKKKKGKKKKKLIAW